MERRDELLQRAEELARELPRGAKNEMKKAMHYFVQHKNYNDLITLLRRPLPWYGRSARDRWEGVRDALTRKRDVFSRDSVDEVAFIFGWAARLLQ